MGYRSDVGFVLSKTGVETLNQKLAVQPDNLRSAVDELLGRSHVENNDCLQNHTVDTVDGSELWHWESIKWYSDFPDVQFIESFMAELDDCDYYFIRIGESDDDVEVNGIFWDNPFCMYLTRGIYFEANAQRNRIYQNNNIKIR